MTHELILTSVAQGLDPGDHGFCPVAADEAITPRIVQHLLALSHYRHITTESEKNPPAYSHLILPGGIEHVLSRLADAGTDYRQQPNILAHHIVLEESEFVTEGPGWLLALPSFHLSIWDEPPVRFVQGRSLPTLMHPPSLTRRQQIARQFKWLDPKKMALTGSVDTESETYLAMLRRNDEQITLSATPTTPCPTWKELTGDAGWGGILAETALTQQPVVLIHLPGQNILPLYVEALALLPPYLSWLTTFCTHFTGLPETISCQWKGAIAGSDEARMLADDLNNLVLDFTEPMGDAPAGRYVDFARSGQEHVLPQDSEDYTTAIVNADTKSYGDDAKKETAPSGISTTILVNQVLVQPLPPPVIQLPKKQAGVFESFLHRSSRSQFYLLYGIMFALVLFLLILVMEQAGWFQSTNPPENPVPPGGAEREIESVLDTEEKVESKLDDTEIELPVELDDDRKIFGENRETQRPQLLQFLESFAVPEYLAANFPNVQDNQVDVPGKKIFGELAPLHPFASALELRFMPLFELSGIKVETRMMVANLPDLVWQVEILDTQTRLGAPMFHFQLTETGLEMDWQWEGLSNQYLYETVLSSLGFLELSVADAPESAIQIPLFEPVQTEPVKVAVLLELAESETPGHVVKLPFTSELWQNVFAEMDPAYNVVIEVTAEPEGDWMRIVPTEAWQFCAEIQTSQQVGKITEGKVTTYEDIGVQFMAMPSLEMIVWTGGAGHARWLRSELADAQVEKKDLEEKINQLKRRAFEGDESVRGEREKNETELRTLNSRLNEIESTLEKLPAAYEEVGRNETWQFRYSVFMQSEKEERRLLILTTK